VQLIKGVLALAVFVFFLALLGRMVLDWIQVFARDWRPRGIVLVVAEAMYSVTDPPLRWLRRVLPPLRIGPVALDLAFMVLFLIVIVSLQLLS
jgi:YggT family protein